MPFRATALQFQNQVWLDPTRTMVPPSKKNFRAKQKERQALNNARKIICPKSDVWHKDFDLDAHREEVTQAEKTKTAYKAERIVREAKEKAWYEACIGEKLPPPPPIRKPFDGKVFRDNRTSVLALESIWCMSYNEGKGRELAPWPPMEELMFEGQGRVSTERIHGRFLPLPREPGDPTQNFMTRQLVEPFEFDNVTYYPSTYPQYTESPYPTEDDTFFRHYRVDDLEFTDPVNGAYDDDAVHALGTDLLALLDPRDQY